MLESYIKQKVSKKGIAVMGHIVCGYPSLDANLEILEELAAAGVDVVEMQFPFSEPIADGPLFLTANQESLKSGTKAADCFALMKKASDVFPFKILMMGYYNTVFKSGEENFCRKLKENGACGMIIPDLPIEEAGSLLKSGRENDQALIRLVAPNTKNARMREVLDGAEGFVYAVARKGVTGAKTDFAPGLDDYIARIRKNTMLPVAVGFGISSRKDIEYLISRADIAVIGTAVLKAFISGGRKGIRDFFKMLLG